MLYRAHIIAAAAAILALGIQAADVRAQDGDIAAAEEPTCEAIQAALEDIEATSVGYRVPRVLAEPRSRRCDEGPVAQLQPVYREKSIHGFRLNGITSESLWYRLGLRNGDVVVRVNGEPVDNPQKAVGWYDETVEPTHVTVEIERRGASHTLIYTWVD